MALLTTNGGAGRPEAAGAVEWLSTQRNALGGYGQSTQDTVVALRALFLAARKVRRDLDVDLTVIADGSPLVSAHVDQSNYDLARAFELPIGASLELRSAGSSNVGYQVVRRYNVPGDLLPPPRDMLLDVDYDASHIEVDDILDVRVTMTYTGEKARTGMVIADIGVPTGFDAVRSSLDLLVSSQIASRVELAGRKVIIYIDGPTRECARLQLMRASTPSSRGPDLTLRVLRPHGQRLSPPGQRHRLRSHPAASAVPPGRCQRGRRVEPPTRSRRSATSSSASRANNPSARMRRCERRRRAQHHRPSPHPLATFFGSAPGGAVPGGRSDADGRTISVLNHGRERPAMAVPAIACLSTPVRYNPGYARPPAEAPRALETYRGLPTPPYLIKGRGRHLDIPIARIIGRSRSSSMS
jgi:hypothetical protein